MNEREMLEAAERAMGITITWENGQEFPERVEPAHGGLQSYEPWDPRNYSSDSFELAAALRISVEHSLYMDPQPWVLARCAAEDGYRSFMEDVPDESKREDRMRLAILRCAAAQAPAIGCKRTGSDGNGGAA